MLKECSLAMWFSRDDLETARGADFNKRKKTSADIITVSTALQSFGLRPEVPIWTRLQDPYSVPIVADRGKQPLLPWAAACPNVRRPGVDTGYVSRLTPQHPPTEELEEVAVQREAEHLRTNTVTENGWMEA